MAYQDDNPFYSSVPVTTPTAHPYHDPLALTPYQHGTIPARVLPEVPCSVNAFFEVAGMKAQATGRGWTPSEAATNLRDTIAETKAVLAPPAAPESLAKRLSHYAACAMQKAIEEGDHDRVGQIGEAVALVTRGSVWQHPENETLCMVWDHEAVDPMYVTIEGFCGCAQGKWNCAHAMAVWFAKRCDALSDRSESSGMHTIND